MSHPEAPDSTGIGRRAHEVLRSLCDGQRHQGTELAAQLGISRAAVWKHVESLRTLGLDITADAGGYQLPQPPEWLESSKIRAGLTHSNITIEVRFLVESTNACVTPGQTNPQVVLAECQRAGRGRRGRSWRSAPGSGIFLSLGWRFECGLTALAPLSLVTGIAAAQALKTVGVNDIGLKWPNDLIAGGRKLGGCLIDINGTSDGPCDVVFGIGINVDLGQAQDIDQPWTDLRRHGVKVSRNKLASRLIDSLIDHIEHFERHGFQPLMTHWNEMDALAGRQIRVLQPVGEPLEGQADGVDEQGRLRLLGPGSPILVSSGEVSVRAV
jgi:BirA family transcriptional regulator, biotin operon repressor / biotin---[acetyl-CoA-carboxylase] ligase